MRPRHQAPKSEVEHTGYSAFNRALEAEKGQSILARFLLALDAANGAEGTQLFLQRNSRQAKQGSALSFTPAEWDVLQATLREEQAGLERRAAQHGRRAALMHMGSFSALILAGKVGGAVAYEGMKVAREPEDKATATAMMLSGVGVIALGALAAGAMMTEADKQAAQHDELNAESSGYTARVGEYRQILGVLGKEFDAKIPALLAATSPDMIAR